MNDERGPVKNPAATFTASNDNAPDGRLLRAAEVAEWLGLSAATILDWWEAGKLPGFKLNGGPVRFAAAELREWLSAQRRDSTAIARDRVRP